MKSAKQLGEIPEKNKEAVVIISETDVYGKITYANEHFCSISGFRQDELVGKPYSIVRHPSMPGELFRHLWNTIHKGDVFRAVIKNQKKDGHHYWVNATIIPVFRGAQLAGYIGAGQVISNDQVAEELFLKQAREFGWHLQPGTTLFISR